jgi:hypothetical protein
VDRCDVCHPESWRSRQDDLGKAERLPVPQPRISVGLLHGPQLYCPRAWTRVGLARQNRIRSSSAKLCATPNHSFRKLSVDYYKSRAIPGPPYSHITFHTWYLTVRRTQAVVPVTLPSQLNHHKTTQTRGVHCKRSASTFVISNKLGLHLLPPGPSQQPKSSRAD